MHEFDNLINHPDHELEVEGIKILVRDKVFSPDPRLTNSPGIMFRNMPELNGKDVLDMGSGTGILGFYCEREGANKVIGADIFDKALENANENKKSLNSKVEFIKSDLFENLKGEKFDYIFANLPIEDELWNPEEPTTATMERFLKNAKEHLKKNGKVFIIWFSIRPVQPIRDLIKRHNYNSKEIIENKLGYDWSLFILS